MAEANDRRRFLKEGAALAGLGLGAASFASGQTFGTGLPEAHPKDLTLYGEPSRFVNTVRGRDPNSHGPFVHGPNALTPLQDSIGIITPAPLHFVSSHGNVPPDIDPREHRLMIHGMVNRPLVFTLEELKRLPFVSRIYFIECSANKSAASKKTVQETHGKTACSEWTGVRLSLLLKEAGVQQGASWLVAEGAEASQYTRSLPLAKAMEDVLVAYGQNGEPVRPHQGYPLRLLVPGWKAANDVKWLRRIKVVTEPYLHQQEITDYVDVRPDTGGNLRAARSRWINFEQGPKSVITSPSGGQQLPSRGFYMITGLAWSGGGAIRRVEVSTDGGRTWKDAQLEDPVLRIAHTRFSFPWKWSGEEAVLQSRCTDDLGQVQPTLAEFARFWGAASEQVLSGSASGVGHVTFIQPWKVTREGGVHNALA
jgi:sulfane dehydrogenase subunit SoxC